MSLLAEPRRRRKQWRNAGGEDPQNLRWKNDKGKMGRRLMEQMGWREGMGLGAEEQGVTENLRLKANHNARGLGAPPASEASDAWIGYHNDFAKVLQELNAKKGRTDNDTITTELSKSCDEAGRKNKKRLKTKRRLLARVEDDHRAAIFGTSSNRKQHPKHSHKNSDDAMSDTQRGDRDSNEGCPGEKNESKLVVSERSTTEYFKAKMEALASRRGKFAGKEISKA